jgi:hypothetical protein
MYRLSMWLIALAFVFNGAASYTWADPGESPALTIQGHHGALEAAPGAHAKYVGDDMVTAADQAPTHSHNALRCCYICNVASVLPDIVAIPMPFSYTAIMFHTARHNLVGHPLGLDPGIPKTIV